MTKYDVWEKLDRVLERIARASSRSGRRAEEIVLVAVSKTHPAERILELYEAGVRHFGENRLQEWESKRTHLLGLNTALDVTSDMPSDVASDMTVHMIGHVQSNKAARVARLFSNVDTVDTVSLAQRLDKAFDVSNTEPDDTSVGEKGNGEQDRENRLRVLIEVKLDPEPAKSGVNCDANTDELLSIVKTTLRLPHLDLRGLLGVPPYFDDPEKVRPYFRRLRELRDSLRESMGDVFRESSLKSSRNSLLDSSERSSRNEWSGEILPVLSMGMSHDFEVAIEEGATEIRVGSALFGDRPKV